MDTSIKLCIDLPRHCRTAVIRDRDSVANILVNRTIPTKIFTIAKSNYIIEMALAFLRRF
jgi:hypothetical protein